MFTGIVTAVTIFFGIGVTKSIIADKSGKTKNDVTHIIKESAKWPKDVYNKLKEIK